MPIYKITKDKFQKIKEKNFDYERDMQASVEKNLEEVFGLEFVSGALNKEFSVKNQHQTLYMDTLAFDHQANTFVIIEYKKDRSFSVIDQGYAYLSGMLNNKAEFVLEYNERKNKNLKKDGVDWSQARVMFLAREFTSYQKGAIGFRDLPIELWEVQLMEGDIIAFNQIKPAETQESITKVSKGNTIEKVAQELKSFTLEDHYKKASPETKILFDKLRNKIFALDENIKEKPVQNYLGYKLNWYNFATIHVFKDKIKIHVRKNKLDNDTEKRFTKIPASYEWGKTPIWWIDISSDKDLNYVLEIIKESYESAPDK